MKISKEMWMLVMGLTVGIILMVVRIPLTEKIHELRSG